MSGAVNQHVVQEFAAIEVQLVESGISGEGRQPFDQVVGLRTDWSDAPTVIVGDFVDALPVQQMRLQIRERRLKDLGRVVSFEVEPSEGISPDRTIGMPQLSVNSSGFMVPIDHETPRAVTSFGLTIAIGRRNEHRGQGRFTAQRPWGGVNGTANRARKGAAYTAPFDILDDIQDRNLPRYTARRSVIALEFTQMVMADILSSESTSGQAYSAPQTETLSA